MSLTEIVGSLERVLEISRCGLETGGKKDGMIELGKGTVGKEYVAFTLLRISYSSLNTVWLYFW